LPPAERAGRSDAGHDFAETKEHREEVSK
jgi:hypothetical protein